MPLPPCISSFLMACKDIVFPPACVFCGYPLQSSAAAMLCSSCWAKVHSLQEPWCGICGLPLPGASPRGECPECIRQNFYFDYARAVFPYEEPIRRQVLQIKFQGDLSSLASLAAMIQKSAPYTDFCAMVGTPDVVLPVPLHLHRLRQRMFNQAAVIARACFPQWRDVLDNKVLLRARETQAQTTLSGAARRTNLTHAFALDQTSELAGKTVVLVDDVFTTGATVNACTQLLKSHHVSKVAVFTVARSLPGRTVDNTKGQ